MSRETIQAYLHDYLLQHPCHKCGQNNIHTLCFIQDTMLAEEVTVSKMLVNRYSVGRVKEAVAKSKVVCFNCLARKRVKDGLEHRNKTTNPTASTMQKWQNTDAIRALMGMRGCVDCGVHEQEVLVYDHVVGEKKFGIMQGAGKGYSWERLMEEIKKCEVRCHNCHAIRHQFKEQ